MIKKDKPLKSAFINLPGREISRKNLSRKTISKDDFVILQGNRAEAVYLIDKGVAKCFITEPNGREYIVELLGEGEFLGDLELLTGRPYLCSVQAITELTVIKLKTGLYFDLIENGGELTKLMMKQLASRLHRTSGRASYQQIYPIEYALLKLLLSLQKHEITITKQHLSDYLAIPVRSLNRNLNKLANAGVLQLSGSKIEILSEEKLYERLEGYYH